MRPRYETIGCGSIKMHINDEAGVTWTVRHDVKDKALHVNEARGARMEELAFVEKEGVREKWPIEECCQATGRVRRA